MGRILLAASLCAVIALISCSQHPSVPKVTDTGTPPLKNRIPPPDPSKYSPVEYDARVWQNPYLIVHPNGVEARIGGSMNRYGQMRPVTEIVGFLEKLPDLAWPYGLVVAVQENGLRSQGDDDRIKRNREELVPLLEKAGVKVELRPSA